MDGDWKHSAYRSKATSLISMMSGIFLLTEISAQSYSITSLSNSLLENKLYTKLYF